MKRTMKTRLAVFLSILLILPTILSALPMTSTSVSAAENVNMSWVWQYANTKKEAIQVEVGQKFYVGDYANVNYSSKNDCGYAMASMVKASYASSKTSVATVNKDGYMTTKKTGTTTITIKYKGQKLSAKFKIVPAGTFGNAEAIDGLRKEADKLAKKIPSKITTKNGFSLCKLKADYENYLSEVDDALDVLDNKGMLKEDVKTTYTSNGKTYTYTYKSVKNKIAVPQAGRYQCLSTMLYGYGWKNSPTSTVPSKMMKVKSISATKNTITVKIKKKLTTAQILGARAYGGYMNKDLSDKKTAYSTEALFDAKNNYIGYVKVQMKKGSNTLKLTPQNVKLTKGKKYRLGSKYSWGKGKTFVVK